MWGGVGLATAVGPGDLRVAALAVVNAFGNVRDPVTGTWVAGVRDGSGGFVDVEEAMLSGALARRRVELLSGNTTICVVVTNARLDPAECLRASVLGGQALIRAIRPCQTAMDGDVVFLASTGDLVGDSHQVGVAAARALERAIVRAAAVSNPPGGPLPSSRRSADGGP
jgi:L-aminopeptidase/D-esterase-like protein